VSHELNTPIGSAVTLASTVEDRSSQMQSALDSGQIKKSEIKEFIADMLYAGSAILDCLNRAAHLINHFKQIAVDQSGEQRRQFNLDHYIRGMTSTFNHLFQHSDVKLKLKLNADVMLDTFPGPLSQIIINLVQNALNHGFDEHESGTVTVTTEKIEPNRVKLVVMDTGKGIDKKIVERIFEPFFTTRLGQGGSGLGLHITYNIVTDVLG